MYLDLQRVKRITEDVKKLIVRKSVEVKSYHIIDNKDKYGYKNDLSQYREVTTDENWKCKEKHRWYRTTITIPENFGGEFVEFRIVTGREGEWDACNPQFLFYLNEELIQGMDVNHRRVVIAEKAVAGEKFNIAMLAYGGLTGDDLIVKTYMDIIDIKTQDLYFDLESPKEAIRLLKDDDSKSYNELLKLISPAIDVLDLRKAYSDIYYSSVEASRKILKDNFYTDVRDGDLVSAVGNTHIDVAWLWTVEQTREKVVRSYSTVIELMERYPDYKFIGSQPIFYQFIKESTPELFAKIKEKVKEGRWEVDGAMWVEPDCNIPSGESFVRQILKSEKFLNEEFGKRSKILWLPDVFGYSAALPQILKRADIPYFVTTKLAWNQYNMLPNDTFVWRGIDGSDVFTFMPTTKDYDKGSGDVLTFSGTNNTTTYTGDINVNMALGTVDRFQNKDLTDNTMMLYGYGDGGGGPTREMLENQKRLKFGLPGVPRIETEIASEYLDRVSEEIKSSPRKPTWDGELYFEYHRGTLSSCGMVKKWNRKSEILYRDIEILSSFNNMYFDKEYRREAIEEGLDIILLNQFHDILPGSSISEVYDVAEKEYIEINKKGNEVLKEELKYLQSKIDVEKGQVTVFNTLAFDRTDKVSVRVDSTEYTHAKCGDVLTPVQYTDKYEVCFIAKDIKAFFYKNYDLVKASKESIAGDNTREFENDYYTVKFNKQGQIILLEEKETGIKIINEDNVGNILMTYEDRPANWDNWDLDVFYSQKPYCADSISEIKMIENGNVRRVLEITHKFMDSTIVQNIIMYNKLPRIDFVNNVDWKENNVLLRTLFPTTIYQTKATFEIQFGSVERETTKNNSWDFAKFESCAHKWVDLSDNSVGLSVMNDCKYGHSVTDSTIGMTLIKAGTYPNADADIGKHEFTYSIYPHSGRWVESQTIEEANNVNTDLLAIVSDDSFSGQMDNNFTVDKSNCYVDTIKLSEDETGYVVRAYENKNKQSKVTMKIPDQFTKVYETNLREEIEKDVKIENGEITFNIKPFEIKTYLLKW